MLIFVNGGISVTNPRKACNYADCPELRAAFDGYNKKQFTKADSMLQKVYNDVTTFANGNEPITKAENEVEFKVEYETPKTIE